MKYKLIVSDFDSTLNHDYDNYVVSQRTLDAIDLYRKAGGIFCISTGRAWCSIQPYLNRYTMDLVEVPIMCGNGSAVYSSTTGKILFEERLTNLQTLQIMQFAYDIGEHVQVDIDSVSYVQQNDMVQTYLDFDKLQVQKMDNLLEFVLKTRAEPHTLGILCHNHTVFQLKEEVDQMFDFVDTTVCGNNLLEITSCKAGKGNSALAVAKFLGVPIANTICIGDSYNDVSMIQIAGLGIAMGNARQDVKDVAKLVAGDSKDDGVAKILEQATQDLLD